MSTSIAQLTEEFEQHRAQLRSFVLRISGSESETEDIVQDAYERALRKLDSFRGEASLKTWLFSIAANVARNNRKVRQRWTENVTDLGRAAALENPEFMESLMATSAHSPQGRYEMREQIAFCFACVSKSLPLEQQICLLLKEAYHFKLQEIAVIMAQNLPMVKYFLREARTKMMDIFDHRCALIRQTGVCDQCSELNGLLNPKQQAQEKRMEIAMIRAARTESREKLLALRAELLRDVDPFSAPGAAIQLLQLRHNAAVMDGLQKNEA